MNEHLSRKITFFHVLGVFIVLYIHAFLPNIESSPFNEVQAFMALVVCRVFHPMYFSIAGFLFFFSIGDGHLADFKRKLKSRFRSLVVPYVLCNIIGGVFIIWAGSRGLESGNVSDAYGYYQSHNLLLYLFYKPALGQLWFVRDLILIAMFSYPLYLALKKFRLFTLLVLLAAVVITQNSIVLSFFSFSIGAYLALSKADVEHVPFKKAVFALTILYLSCFGLVWKAAPYYIGAISAWSLFLSLWILYDRIHVPQVSEIVVGGVNYGFFVYVFHDPLMSLTKFALHPVYEHNIVLQAVVYVALPFVFFFGLSTVGIVLNKYCHILFNILTGGRS